MQGSTAVLAAGEAGIHEALSQNGGHTEPCNMTTVREGFKKSREFSLNYFIIDFVKERVK